MSKIFDEFPLASLAPVPESATGMAPEDQHVDELDSPLTNLEINEENRRRPSSFTTLPVELILRIRELSPATTNGRSPQHTSLQLLCRRFREIELGTPSLWTTVSDDMSPERMELQVRRAGELGLSLNVCDFTWEECDSELRRRCRCRCNALLFLKKYSDRWTSLGLELMNFSHNNNVGDVEHGCLFQYPDIGLPSLLSLSLRVSNIDAYRVIRTWTMPALRHFEWEPPPLHSKDLLLPLPDDRPITPLESLELNFRSQSLDVEWVIWLMSQEVMGSISSLRLSFRRVGFVSQRDSQFGHSSASDNPLSSIEHVCLPRITNLSLTSYPHRPFQHDMVYYKIMTRLQMPNLSSLSVEIREYELRSAAFKGWLKWLGQFPPKDAHFMVAGRLEEHPSKAAMKLALEKMFLRYEEEHGREVKLPNITTGYVEGWSSGG